MMKITKVETFRHWVDWCNWLVVRITTDEGIVGWGEGSLHGAMDGVEATIQEMGRGLIGQDPQGPERHWHRIYNSWRWRGGSTFMTALAAIDIALWDIEGKRLGVPIYRLLGGAQRNTIKVYASHWLSGVRTPEKAFEGAREVRRRGFSAFKFIPFTYEGLRANEASEFALAADIMAAAREGAGDDCEIFVECSEFLSPRNLYRLEDALIGSRPGWFEEPIPFENAKVMAQLQQQIKTPIATGERLLIRQEFRELFEQGGCRIAQPDIMHAGGITEVRRIASFADTYCIPIAPHNSGGAIACAATMHLVASIPNFLIMEQMEDQRHVRDAASSKPIELKDGHFILPEGPGLGLEFNLNAMEKYPPQPQPARMRPGSLWW
jgi:galactonate dehydratase